MNEKDHRRRKKRIARNERERGEGRAKVGGARVFTKRSCTCCSHATESLFVPLLPSPPGPPFVSSLELAPCTCYRGGSPPRERERKSGKGWRSGLIYDVASFRTMNESGDSRYSATRVRYMSPLIQSPLFSA